jgi:hypothetical protein
MKTIMKKCDLCGKETSWNHCIKIEWLGMLSHYNFCDDCGVPLAEFLRGNKLISEEKKLIQF